MILSLLSMNIERWHKKVLDCELLWTSVEWIWFHFVSIFFHFYFFFHYIPITWIFSVNFFITSRTDTRYFTKIHWQNSCSSPRRGYRSNHSKSRDLLQNDRSCGNPKNVKTWKTKLYTEFRSKKIRANCLNTIYSKLENQRFNQDPNGSPGNY